MNRWTENVDLPSNWVHAVGPQLCARHGEPAQEMCAVRFHPEMPPWIRIGGIVCGTVVGYACGAIGAVPVVLFAAAVARSKWPPMKVHAWPYCTRCFSLHRLYVISMAAMALGVVGYVLGLAGFVFGLLRPTSSLDGTALALILGGSVLALTGAVVGGRFSWRSLGGAHVSRDRLSLRVVAHGRFAADVRTRLAGKARAAP